MNSKLYSRCLCAYLLSLDNLLHFFMVSTFFSQFFLVFFISSLFVFLFIYILFYILHLMARHISFNVSFAIQINKNLLSVLNGRLSFAFLTVTQENFFLIFFFLRLKATQPQDSYTKLIFLEPIRLFTPKTQILIHPSLARSKSTQKPVYHTLIHL